MRLDRKEALRWLEGQREVQRRIERERARFLLRLGREGALSIYLGLWASAPKRAFWGPSPLLMAVRKALARMEGKE